MVINAYSCGGWFGFVEKEFVKESYKSSFMMLMLHLKIGGEFAGSSYYYSGFFIQKWWNNSFIR